VAQPRDADSFTLPTEPIRSDRLQPLLDPPPCDLNVLPVNVAAGELPPKAERAAETPPGGLNPEGSGAEMAKECFVKFGAGRYWVSTKTGTHPSKEFPTRAAVKGWLVENGVSPTVAEGYLLRADAGRAARVRLSKGFIL
jgi:hypothetical protein